MTDHSVFLVIAMSARGVIVDFEIIGSVRNKALARMAKETLRHQDFVPHDNGDILLERFLATVTANGRLAFHTGRREVSLNAEPRRSLAHVGPQ